MEDDEDGDQDAERTAAGRRHTRPVGAQPERGTDQQRELERGLDDRVVPQAEPDLGAIAPERQVGRMDEQIEQPVREDDRGDHERHAGAPRPPAAHAPPRPTPAAAAPSAQSSAAGRLCVYGMWYRSSGFVAVCPGTIRRCSMPSSTNADQAMSTS